MKEDIEFPEVAGVDLVIARENQGEEKWGVYLINRNLIELQNVMVTSKGYGEIEKVPKKTSVLRHHIEAIQEQSYALIEPVDPAVFQLSNEFWVSYYIMDQLFDKKFVFLPDTITEDNLRFIPELEMQGVRHA